MDGFRNVSILLPTLNETFSFIQTVRTVLDECDGNDICEFIAIICDRTKKESLGAIREAEKISAKEKIPLRIIRQTLPFAGGAVRDGIDAAKGSHVLLMAPDLETDPHSVKDLIREGRKYPDDMITASRWLRKGSFEGYDRKKLIFNFFFQKIFSVVYGVKLTDLTFAYRLAPTRFMQSIAWEEVRHPFFLETALKPIRLGMTVHEIPSAWKARQEGESQNSFIQTFRYLKIAIKVRFERKSRMLKECTG